ncbi:hypothetical protein [Streptomyces sp. AS02]|uniref:hypothetical protein n=1 Tax=Streptomyces sp. AS02 TaxID=2938946 RepID=UPI00201FD44E|nr:hypothetical protein [Streptomyces sp. AS02]MCL8013985.1 hypothetical protein [Streptomyces sp. AS02]
MGSRAVSWIGSARSRSRPAAIARKTVTSMRPGPMRCSRRTNRGQMNGVHAWMITTGIAAWKEPWCRMTPRRMLRSYAPPRKPSMPITAIAADAANAGIRKRLNRGIGAALRLSTKMKAAMKTAKVTKDATTGPEPQPSEGPWMMPYSRASTGHHPQPPQADLRHAESRQLTAGRRVSAS